jgi:hypothetical protein
MQRTRTRAPSGLYSFAAVLLLAACSVSASQSCYKKGSSQSALTCETVPCEGRLRSAAQSMHAARNTALLRDRGNMQWIDVSSGIRVQSSVIRTPVCSALQPSARHTMPRTQMQAPAGCSQQAACT